MRSFRQQSRKGAKKQAEVSQRVKEASDAGESSVVVSTMGQILRSTSASFDSSFGKYRVRRVSVGRLIYAVQP